MTQYLARMSQIAAGAALAVKSGALRANDLLSVQMMDGTTVDARIDALSSDTASIEFAGRRIMFRPWRYGDRAIGRFPGDNSMWTALEQTPVMAGAE